MHRFKKSLAIILIIATIVPQLFFLTLPPQRAHASGFGPTPTWELPFGTNAIKEWLLDFFARLLAEVFIRKLGDAVVSWIQGGETNFVQDIEAAFQRTADEEAGRFLNQLTGVNMCGNINLFLQITLRIGLSGNQRRARYRCTLTSIVANVENFYEDFQQGGWEAFVRLNVQMQNTAHGAYFIALDEKNSLERRKTRRLKEDFGAGAGFLGVRQTRQVCTPVNPTTEPDGGEFALSSESCKDVTRTTTPGRAVADQLSKTLGTDFDFTVVADEINEIIVRIVSALIHRVMSSELLDFDSGGPSHSRGTPQFSPVDPKDRRIEELAPSTTCGATSGGTLATLKETAQVGESVTWRVQFGNQPASWTWNDSDGNSASSTEAFLVTYQTSGTKTATVTNCYNDVDSKTGQITGQTCNAPVTCKLLTVSGATGSTTPPAAPPPPPGTPPPPPGTPPPPPPFTYTLSVAPVAISVPPGRRGTTTAMRTTTAGTPLQSTLTVGTLPSDLLSNILTNRICTPSPTCNSEIEFSVRLGAATRTSYSIVIDVEPPDPQPSNGPQVITVTVP